MYELLIIFWIFLGNIKFIKDKKLNDNFINIINSIFSSLFAYKSLNGKLSIDFSCQFSRTYFICDTFNILINRGLDYPYLFHHLCSIYILQQMMIYDEIYRNIMMNGFIIIEMSNLSIFTTYHLIQNNYNNYMIKLIQILWYGYFRINLLTQCLIEYNCLDIKYDFLYLNLWIVYFMGISWWIIQNYKFYNENKIYEKLRNIKIKYLWK